MGACVSHGNYNGGISFHFKLRIAVLLDLHGTVENILITWYNYHMNLRKYTLFKWLVLLALIPCSCSSTPDNTIARSSGVILGTVTASAVITNDQAAGIITGDTMKYGYIENTNRSNTRAREMINAATSTTMQKAYANAVYEIIRQVKEKGGDAVTNVVSNTHREYDPETRIEVVKVTITADAVKADKKPGGK
jgi:uncharacterized protein YbjQ (UPF0145 family)